MRDEATEQSLAADLTAIYQQAEAERLSGLRDRVLAGVQAMVRELSAKGMNPMIGVTIGSLMGILKTMLDHATDAQTDAMLVKMIAIMGSWRNGEQPIS